MPDPLSAEDRELLARAAELHRPLARAAKIAHGNGGWLMVFGGAGVLFGIFGPDYPSLLISAAVVTVGIMERRYAARLRQADPQAPRLLARNELMLMTLLILFGVLALTVLRSDSSEIERAMGGSMSGMDIKGLNDAIANVMGAATIGVALIYQGGMARYFSRKKRDVERFLDEIPEWARDVVQQMAG